MKRLLIIAALIGAVPASAAPAPSGFPSPVVPLGLGVNIHFVEPPARDVRMIAAAEFRFVRMDFSWSGIERQRGEYNFAGYDHLVAALARHRIRPYFILDYGNPLYDEGLAPHTDEGRQAFARFAAAAAAHFRGRGVIWELRRAITRYAGTRSSPASGATRRRGCPGSSRASISRGSSSPT